MRGVSFSEAGEQATASEKPDIVLFETGHPRAVPGRAQARVDDKITGADAPQAHSGRYGGGDRAPSRAR